MFDHGKHLYQRLPDAQTPKTQVWWTESIFTQRIELTTRRVCGHLSHLIVTTIPTLGHLICTTVDPGVLDVDQQSILGLAACLMTMLSHRSPPQRMASPKVRAACEACHQRKIRCETSIDGGSCQACDASGRRCFFIPRAKAGRPRLSRSSRLEHGVCDSSLTVKSHDAEDWQFMPNIITPTSDRASRSDVEWSELSNLETADFFNEEYEPVFAERPMNLYQYRGDHRGTETGGSCSTTTTGVDTASPASLDFHMPTSGSDRAHDTAEFSTLLRTCMDLQRIHQSIRACRTSTNHVGLLSSGKLRGILQSLDTAGDTVINTTTRIASYSNEPHRLVSASAMVVTTLLKLLEVCRILVQDGTPTIQTISQVQLLKRVEFNIVQARTAVKQLRLSHASLTAMSQEVLATASHLRRDIRSALESLPPELGSLL